MAVLRPEQIQDYARRRLGLQSEADIGRRRIGEDFGLTSNRLAEESQQGQRDVGNQLASQGLFNSGIRVNEQGQVVSRYNQAQSDLNLQRTRGIEDLERSLAGGLAGIGAEEASALAEANRQEQVENQRRAEQEAMIRASQVAPPSYPNSVIALGGGQAQAANPLAGIPQYRPPTASGGQYANWPQFQQANPELANLLLFFNRGDTTGALRAAVNDGYILRQVDRPVASSQLSRY